MIERKNVQSRKYVWGQFFTPVPVCKKMVSGINFGDSLVIEPSFGTGNFLKEMHGIPNEKIGIEIDPDLFRKYHDDTVKLVNMDFYDFDIKTNKKLIFIGNPPYRTPAYSLGTHKKFVLNLMKKYGLAGIREEAVFFIVHTIDIILRNGGNGEIYYIVPKSLLKNNSKFFDRFKRFLKDTCTFLNIFSINGTDFDDVTQDLVCLSLKVKSVTNTIHGGIFGDAFVRGQDTVVVDGKTESLDKYLCLDNDDVIPFQKIFKKTYLGSVPCESILMSVAGEPVEHFRSRLCKIISDKNITINKLYDLLQYNGRRYLKIFDNSFDSDIVQDKLKIILSYVQNMQSKEDIITDFWNRDNYKPIMGRDMSHYYFRCAKLKKQSNFVYELNPNPCPSFYFTGNPSHSSTDYFGFCEYDCNRNMSPGANRTVPVDGIEDNLTDYFKEWWLRHTNEPFSNVFDYIIYISKTQWYRQMKKNNKRFYFAIPIDFVPQEERQLKKIA